MLEVFVPTKNEAIVIIAGGKTLDFIKQDSSLNKIPSQTTAIISQFLQNEIDTLKSK